MKVSVSTKDLKAAVAIAGKAINARSPLPILGHLLLQASPQILSVTGHDLDTGVVVDIDSDVNELGEFTVPATAFAAIVNLAGSKTLEISTLGEGRIEVSANNDGKRGTWELSSLPGDEYPSLPALDGRSFVLPSAALGNAIEEATVAVAEKAEDSGRNILTGLSISTADGVLTCVGCDGRRLAVAQRSIDFQGEMAPAIIPLRVVVQIAKQLGSSDDVRVFLTGRHAFFEVGRKRWFARLLEGIYPDWTKVIPTRDHWPWVCRVNRKSLIEAVKGAMVTAKEENSPGLVRIQFKDECLNISSNTPDLGCTDLTIGAEGEGPGVLPDYGINGAYLLAGLNAIETEHILWELQDNQKASVVRPDDDITFRYVVMPVRLADLETVETAK